MAGIKQILHRYSISSAKLESRDLSDETRDTTHTPRKKEPELEYGPDDCIGRIDNEPVDWNAVDENGEPPF